METILIYDHIPFIIKLQQIFSDQVCTAGLHRTAKVSRCSSLICLHTNIYESSTNKGGGI